MSLLDSFRSLFKSAPGPKKVQAPKPPKPTKPVKIQIVDINKRFDLLGRTGQGSMSKVWRAYDKKSGRTVCLKVLDREKTAKFEARFTGLKRPPEGEVCMALRHKNIVQTFEWGMTKEKEPFMVMELIDGVGLNFLIENRSQQLDGNRVNYLRQCADGLEFVHSRGFLHRDICPRNIMISKEGIVKIIDFGLAIPNKDDFCKPGNRTGTPDYMAPELIRRVRTDLRVDMFALGVTAYQIFTFDLPWERDPTAPEFKQVNYKGRDPREFVRDIDPKVIAFLDKAIERDPRDRFQNPADFRDGLDKLPPGL